MYIYSGGVGDAHSLGTAVGVKIQVKTEISNASVNVPFIIKYKNGYQFCLKS